MKTERKRIMQGLLTKPKKDGEKTSRSLSPAESFGLKVKASQVVQSRLDASFDRMFSRTMKKLERLERERKD